MNNSMLKRLLSVFIALLLFFYIGYQIYSANYSTVRTETALSKTEADTIETTGIAIRKESLIEQPANGVVAYAIEDGGHIHKGGTVAVTYANEADATAQRRLQELDSEIEKLQKLNAPGDTYAANPDSLNKQINQELTDLLIASRQEGLSGLSEYREEFLYLLNEKADCHRKGHRFQCAHQYAPGGAAVHCIVPWDTDGKHRFAGLRLFYQPCGRL